MDKISFKPSVVYHEINLPQYGYESLLENTKINCNPQSFHPIQEAFQNLGLDKAKDLALIPEVFRYILRL